MDTLRVSVVIPVFNGGPDLEKCLAAVAASSYPVFECIVVDDASSDGMTAPAAARHGARVIQLDQQSGPAIARNRGAMEAGGDILFFTDADVVIHPDTLAVAVDVLASGPELGAVFGSYDDDPGHRAFLSQYRNLLHHWVHQTSSDRASTFWSGCGAIRREIFLEMGGFSQEYPRPSIEDIELGSRLRSAGYNIRLEKNMLCQHMKRWTFWNMIRTDIFQRGVPWTALMLRDRRASSDLNLNLRSRIATFLAGLFGLALICLLLTGHVAALAPAAALLLAAVACSRLACPSGERVGSLLVAILAVSAPVAAYLLAPDPLALVPLVLILLLAWTQLAFYRYCAQKRNSCFAFAVVPMQLVFFVGCVVSFLLGVSWHFLGVERAPAAR